MRARIRSRSNERCGYCQIEGSDVVGGARPGWWEIAVQNPDMTGAEWSVGTALVETEPLFGRPPCRRQPIEEKILAPGQEREMVGPKVVSRIEEAHRPPSYPKRYPLALPSIAVRTGTGVIVDVIRPAPPRPRWHAEQTPWTYASHKFAGIICSTWKVLVVGSKQYSQASRARRRTTARTSRLSELWTERRRRAAMRRSSPGWSINAFALVGELGTAQSMSPRVRRRSRDSPMSASKRAGSASSSRRHAIIRSRSTVTSART